MRRLGRKQMLEPTRGDVARGPLHQRAGVRDGIQILADRTFLSLSGLATSLGLDHQGQQRVPAPVTKQRSTGPHFARGERLARCDERAPFRSARWALAAGGARREG
jgi:hypothetical protein